MAQSEAARAEAFAKQADRSRELAAGYVGQALANANAVRQIKAAVDIALAGISIPHRWAGTVLELLSPSGEWVAGPDLRGLRGVGFNGATINESGHLILGYEDGEVVDTGAMPLGPQGPAGTISIQEVITLPYGSPAVIENVGTPENAQLVISIPAGRDGLDGEGSGDVTGPAGAVANRLAAFADETGKVLVDSGILMSAIAPLASPVFTDTPTAPTAAAGTNTQQLATTAFVAQAIAALVDGAPGAIDTLNELATALGNDPNFATTMLNALAGKAASVHTHTVANLSDASANARSFLQAANYAAMFGLVKQAASESATGVVELATAAEYRSAAGNLALTPQRAWDAAAPVAVTLTGSVTVDFATFVHRVITATGNITLGVTSNIKKGHAFVWEVIHSGAARTISVDTTYWSTPGGTGLTLSTSAGARDILSGYVMDNGKVMLSVAAKGVA